MKKKQWVLWICFVSAMVFTAPAAYANPLLNTDATNTAPEPPPQNMPAMPNPQSPPPAVQEVTIPPLPPALPCRPQWIYGIWELQRLYESPFGTETQAYNLNPVQYLGYGRDSRFYRFNAGKNRMDPVEIYKTMITHSGALLQFLLQDAGMLYIYQERVATDTMVCFIVAETRPPFGAGNMLLMPPKGQVNGRLIKQYKKVWPPKPQPQQAPQPAPRPTYRHFGGR